jgi:hypothetical protein
VARSAFRPPTLRTVGILGAAAGVIGLIAPLWCRSGAPPFATIDAPAANALVARCFVAKGRVDPGTIRRPLWLLKAERGERWREVGRVYPPPGTWGSRVCVGRDVSSVRLALVLADDELDARLAGPPPAEPPDDDIPDWLKRGASEEQCGGGRRHRRAFGPIPDGAKLVASAVVRVLDGVDDDGPACVFTPLDGWPGTSPSLADEGQRRRRHDERRRLSARGGL